MKQDNDDTLLTGRRPVSEVPSIQVNYDGPQDDQTHARGGHGIFGEPKVLTTYLILLSKVDLCFHLNLNF